MDMVLSRFTIDDYLKRYSSALVHLSQCAPNKTFDDVLTFVKKHQLHKEAMRLYKDQRDQYDVRASFSNSNIRLFSVITLISLLRIINLPMLVWVSTRRDLAHNSL